MIRQSSTKAVLMHGAAIIVMTVGSSAAFAQSATPPAAENESQDIIVTAQKREQRLQDVGLSITTQTGEQLVKAGVSDLSQLSKVVPALSIGRSQFGFPIISLRGVNLQTGYLSAQPTVSTYVDQALLAYPSMTQGAFLDVERIEVLKGPQGTLFGANVTGGAINIIAAKPTSTLQAGFRAEVNHFGGVKLEGFVSGPVSDTLAYRLAASTEQFGAWQKCYFGCSQKNGDANRGNVRLLLDWTPTDQLTVAINLNANYDHSEPQQFRLAAKTIQIPAAALPGLATYPFPPRDNRRVDFAGVDPRRQHDRTYQGVLRIDYEFSDVATLTSLTNVANTHRFANFDGDATVLPLSFNQTFGAITSVNQEVRIGGKIRQPNINYVLGASYQRDNILDGQSANWAGYSGIPIGADAVIRNPVDYRSIGVFGSADWEFTPGLTLTAGGRYAWLREATKGCFADGGSGLLGGLFGGVSDLLRGAFGLPANPPGTFGPGQCFALDDRPEVLGTAGAFLPYNADLSQREKNFSWKVGLNYKPSQDTLLYGLVSRGYKAGGIPPGYNTVATQFIKVKQEKLTAYEVGLKGSFVDRKVQLNAAAFYYDYVDKQFLTLSPGLIGDQFITTNIPKSKVKGIEGDVTIRPSERFTFRGGLTYINTKVGSFVTYTGVGQTANIKGNSFNLAPDWTGNFDAEYRQPISNDIEGFVGFGGVYNSSTFADLGETPNYRLKGYTSLDARIGLDSAKGWTGYVWVRNLTDAFYLNNVTTGADVLMSTTGLPRTFGATLSFKFGG